MLSAPQVVMEAAVVVLAVMSNTTRKIRRIKWTP